MKLFIIILSLVLVSCNSQKKAAMSETEIASSESENRLELIMQEAQGGFDADELLVIRDVKRLKSFFSKINRTRKPGLPIPAIDFEKEMILIQCTREESQTNLATLSVIEETDTQVIINVENRSKTKNALIADSSGSFCIYKMAITTKDVILEKRTK